MCKMWILCQLCYLFIFKYGKENDWIPFNLCEFEGMSVLEFTVNYRLHHRNVTFKSHINPASGPVCKNIVFSF